MAHGSGEAAGFIVIYRWRVLPAHEQPFRTRWREATLQARARGGFGSCLTKEEAGDFVAIALWPSESARAAAFESMGPGEPWPGVRRVSETRLQVEENLWGAASIDGA